jgi:hypothetical protein
MANGGAPIPVFCDDCGGMWITQSLFGVSGGGSIQASMTNVSVSPCPHCGGTGHLIDGSYEISRNSVRILGGLPAPVRIRVREEVERARAENADPQAIADRIENLATRIDSGAEANVQATEQVGNEVRALAGEIRKMRRADWKWWLMFAATFLAEQIPPWYGQPGSSTPPASTTTGTAPQPPTDDEIDRIVRGVMERMQDTPNQEAPPATVARVGRNEPCPCGSGSKYKRCHAR